MTCQIHEEQVYDNKGPILIANMIYKQYLNQETPEEQDNLLSWKHGKVK